MRSKIDWKLSLFLLAITSGIFLRVFHFSDWLFFKRDQARDAFAIWQAYAHGPSWLPLLGPNATGSEFYSGPIFYYFQYLASLLFQSVRPAVLAFPDLFFSMLTIPLFYFFLKKYFSRDWSLVLAALFSVNFLAVEYSRFAWNPNSLPFFNLLYFYSLLNIFDSNVKHQWRWAFLAGVSFAVATQLHVLSEIALPIITIFFLFLKIPNIKKHFDWKKIAVAAFSALLIYIPVFINEIATHASNTRRLFSAVKGEPYYSSFAANLLAAAQSIGQGWILVLSGYIVKETEYFLTALAWVVLILPALWLIVKKFRKEKDEGRKNFLLLLLLWFFGYIAIFLPVALHFQPRFFLPILFLPLIFLALILLWLWDKNSKILKGLSIAILFLAFLGNIAGIFLWFGEMRGAEQGSAAKPERTVILKIQDGIMLWHLEQAAEYMKNSCDKPAVYYSAEPEYGTPLEYVLKLRGVDAYPLEMYSINQPGCFFAFDPSRLGENKLDKKIVGNFSIVEYKSMGILRVYGLQLKENADMSIFGETSQEKKRQLLWRDLAF